MKVFVRTCAMLLFIVVGCLALFGQAPTVLALGMSPSEFWIEEPLDYNSSVGQTVWISRDYGSVGELVLQYVFSEADGDYFSADDDLVIPADQQGAYYTFYVTPGYVAGGEYVGIFTMSQVESDADEAVGGAGVHILGSVAIKVHFSVVEGNEDNSPPGGGSDNDSDSDTSAEDDASTPETEEEAAEEEEEVTEEAAAEEEAAVTEESAVDVVAETPETPALADEPSPAPTEESESAVAPESVLSAEPSYDLNKDDVVDTEDVAAFFQDYFDSPGLRLSDLADLLASSSFLPDRLPVAPPVASGPPLATDSVVFYFEKAVETGGYQFKLTSSHAKAEADDDRLTFYLLVDTGETGVMAEDLTFHFNPEVLQFVSADTSGSLFPYSNMDYGDLERGALRLVAAARENFVGTRGYLASFVFRPITEGVGGLAFSDVEIYQGEDVEGNVAESHDLSGRLQKEKEPETVAVSEVSSQNTQLFRVLLWLMAISSTALLFVLRKLTP